MSEHDRPAPGWPPPPPPPPRKGRGLRLAVVVVVGVLLFGGAVAGVGAFLLGQDPASADAGDCIRYTDPGQPGAAGEFVEVEAQKVDCSDERALYQVAIRFSDRNAACPTEEYDEYIQDGRDLKLCLIPNATEGACYEFTETGERRIDCGLEPTGNRLKVLRVFTGVNEPARCDDVPGTAQALAYPAPPLTVCTGAL